MSNAMIRIITRVVRRRYEDGEDIDEVLAEYTKLASEEREHIRNEIIPPEPDIDLEEAEVVGEPYEE